jgi:hypothetical protein
VVEGRAEQEFLAEIAEEAETVASTAIYCTCPSGRPTLIAEFGKKPAAIMAFKTFQPTREAVTLEALGTRIAGRKAALGLPDPPRNAGKNRTPSKRALLKAIEDLGGKW